MLDPTVDHLRGGQAAGARSDAHGATIWCSKGGERTGMVRQRGETGQVFAGSSRKTFSHEAHDDLHSLGAR